MQKTDAELIAEVEGLDAKASPGPWIWRADFSGYARAWMEAAPASDDEDSNTILVTDGGAYPPNDDDGNFILQARTLLPELARRLKAANERIEKLAPYRGILTFENGSTIKASD